jgi:23S rRNA (uracil1939-C5)-methyltransferase
MKQHKMIRGPLMLSGIHSSGRSIGMERNRNVYLDCGIPGETVMYTLERRKKGFPSGKTESILEPSPYRKVPFCGHYSVCGGCAWQHIDYTWQLELKREILKNALEKYGILHPPLPPVIASPETTHFRHRMEYSFSSKAYRGNMENGPKKPGIGFHPAGEPRLVNAINNCWLQSDPSRDIWKKEWIFMTM